ncbi:endonuclease/exonuclease/phosphatase family protein [Dactylosporangium sp. NBC_01737]|uniref:endonuclease/exonuclease/phosphatase family protein n=1 Tax=Dactylosporangium sp. NBC_01737 TaxID=2975959 RepID=UPI002E167116|nr:endonuclease/exonuclease/phosphatase family protein [Dactylosporangium sp. NBC_01737]
MRFLALLVLAGALHGAGTGAPFRMLQLNLCNSGHAGVACYRDGWALAAAVQLIETVRPDVVTVNEVCDSDVAPLRQALGNTGGGVFQAVWDRAAADWMRCSGDRGRYGVAVVARERLRAGGRGGLFPPLLQAHAANELRAWVCGAFVSFVACTAHPQSPRSGTGRADAAVALAQCRYVAGGILPGYPGPAVFGADLNLVWNGRAGAQRCVPAGWHRKGDGAFQHVLYSPAFEHAGTVTYPVRGTDHDALLVHAVRVAAARSTAARRRTRGPLSGRSRPSRRRSAGAAARCPSG